MKKEYQTPSAEYISLAVEAIATDAAYYTDEPGLDIGITSSPFI